MSGGTARKLRAEGAVERVEGLKKLWKEWYPDKLSYHDEAKFMHEVHIALRDMEDDAGRSPEPSPEYDEMISCFLPGKQRQELKDKGLNQHEIAKVKGFVKQMTISADEKARIAAEEKRAAAEKAKINKLKTTLEKGGWYGRQSVKTLNDSEYRIGFDSLGSVASNIDPEAKTITLNSAMSDESQVMSLVNAACVLKQEKDGADKSPEVMAVRRADVFMTQAMIARSLDPYKKPSPEQIAKICRGFDGKSYYTPDNWYSEEGKKEMAADQSGQTEFKKQSGFYKEKLNPAIIAKAKQQGR